jgi:hypothetical protein
MQVKRLPGWKAEKPMKEQKIGKYKAMMAHPR